LLITWCRNHGRLFTVFAHRPDPDDASAQIDLIGVPWMIISRERQPHRTAARRAHLTGRHSP
jgi:hypothetical protein